MKFLKENYNKTSEKIKVYERKIDSLKKKIDKHDEEMFSSNKNSKVVEDLPSNKKEEFESEENDSENAEEKEENEEINEAQEQENVKEDEKDEISENEKITMKKIMKSINFDSNLSLEEINSKFLKKSIIKEGSSSEMSQNETQGIEFKEHFREENHKGDDEDEIDEENPEQNEIVEEQTPLKVKCSDFLKLI